MEILQAATVICEAHTTISRDTSKVRRLIEAILTVSNGQSMGKPLEMLDPSYESQPTQINTQLQTQSSIQEDVDWLLNENAFPLLEDPV